MAAQSDKHRPTPLLPLRSCLQTQQAILHQILRGTVEADAVDTTIDFLTTATVASWRFALGRVIALTWRH